MMTDRDGSIARDAKAFLEFLDEEVTDVTVLRTDGAAHAMP